MPTSGSYEFKLAPEAEDGLIVDEKWIGRGEWAWIERDTTATGGRLWRSIYARCPDCGELMTLWRSYGDQTKGHDIDAQGNVHPSLAHSWIYDGVEKCGFHTQPTKLLDFVERRK